ncbi:hypothetical protein E1287_07375 [Actinomadura sp. KC06]|uniref:hypothetical protein n=1 Tax=Actinomadura sp. KC06 TaxID=2530369 RepID=UPI00104E95F8|nr:hypothetical protein [Actinomadura sp. KC06]TDD37868.1 hypothetical protein E1287_07375 [Actinomadura sp. KC06]
MTMWHRIPEPLINLLRRIKRIEHPDGSWPGADVVDTVTTWLTEHGLDPAAPAEEIPPGEPRRIYRRTVTVECSTHVPLDEADLDHAITGAVTGTAVRVEHADLAETFWIELDATGITATPR